MKAALIFKAGELYELGCNSSQAVCGAMAGQYGLDTSIPGDTGTREENYRMVRELVAEFKRRHGSVFCATLCGPAGKDRKRCRKLVESAVEIYADYLGWQ